MLAKMPKFKARPLNKKVREPVVFATSWHDFISWVDFISSWVAFRNKLLYIILNGWFSDFRSSNITSAAKEHTVDAWVSGIQSFLFGQNYYLVCSDRTIADENLSWFCCTQEFHLRTMDRALQHGSASLASVSSVDSATVLFTIKLHMQCQ